MKSNLVLTEAEIAKGRDFGDFGLSYDAQLNKTAFRLETKATHPPHRYASKVYSDEYYDYVTPVAEQLEYNDYDDCSSDYAEPPPQSGLAYCLLKECSKTVKCDLCANRIHLKCYNILHQSDLTRTPHSSEESNSSEASGGLLDDGMGQPKTALVSQPKRIIAESPAMPGSKVRSTCIRIF